MKMVMGDGSGVFPNLLNHRSFFDKVVISIRGVKKPAPGGAVSKRENKAIGGQGSYYGRVERGVLATTGNPYDLKYGVMRKRGIIPPLMLILRSDQTPLGTSNASAAINLLCEKNWTALVSQVELTFDLTGTSVEFLSRSVLSPARKFPSIRGEFGQTQYVGTLKSHWQVRIYDKTAHVVRVEFVFRREFLRKHSIDAPADLARLRDLDLKALLRLGVVNPEGLKRLENRIAKDYVRRIPARWLRLLPLREFLPAVRKQFGAKPGTLWVPLPLEKRLWNMQHRLVGNDQPPCR